LRDADLRNRFYERFSLFARTLALALSSSNFLEATKRETIERYKKDLKFFQNLRAAVTLRYQEVVDTDDDIPNGLVGNDMARRYFGQVRERISTYGTYNENTGAEIAIEIVDRISRHKIRDWRTNPDAINRMRGEIDDILFEIEEKRGLDLSLDDHDAIIDRCIEVAISNED